MRPIDLFAEPFGLRQRDALESISEGRVSLQAEWSLVLLKRVTVQTMLKTITSHIEET